MNIKKILLKAQRASKNNTYYKNRKKALLKNIVLLEAGQGKNLNGNMFYILKDIEYKEKWKKYIPYFVVTEKNILAAKERFDFYKFKKVRLVLLGSSEYKKILATAKYLINDNSFPVYFHKREDQVYINTWHGTIVGKLGRGDIADSTSILNVQKNFMAADYCQFPNKFTKDAIINDYMMYNIATCKALNLDYTKNDALLDKKRAQEMRRVLNLEGKQVLAYMPTWRASSGRTADIEGQKEKIRTQLAEIDSKLNDNQILLLNLHFLVGNDMDYSNYKHIKRFDQRFETYDVLCTVDILISDYSSVVEDFAVTGRKVIHFAYDWDDPYITRRNLYVGIQRTKFPIVKNIDELIYEINNPRYSYDNFPDFYRPYGENRGESTDKFLEFCINEKKDDLFIEPIPHNSHPNTIYYLGNINNTRRHAGLLAKIKQIDVTKENAILIFTSPINRKTVRILQQIPENMQYARIAKPFNSNLHDYIYYNLYKKFGIFRHTYEKVISYEFDRIFPGWKIDNYVNFGKTSGNIDKLIRLGLSLKNKNNL